jgi:hypothetical protein
MGANEVLKGRYSMMTTGFTIDDSLTLPGATIKGDDRQDYPANLKVLEPISALAIVSYDGSDHPSGGTIAGSGVLRFMSQAKFVKFTDKKGAARSAVQYIGTSALDGMLGQTPEPIPVKQFEILPISRYWVDDPERLTGRAVMFIKHGTEALANSSVSVLHSYFVLTGSESNADRALNMSFIVTDSRFFEAPLKEGDGRQVPAPPTVFNEWGTQTRISDGFLAARSLTDVCGGDLNLRDRLLGFAQSLGLQIPVS